MEDASLDNFDDPAYEEVMILLEEVSELMKEGLGELPTVSQYFGFVERVLKYSSNKLFADIPPYAVESVTVKTRKLKNYKPKPGDVFSVPDTTAAMGWFLLYAGYVKPLGHFFYTTPKKLPLMSSPNIDKEVWEFCIRTDLDMIQDGKWIRRKDLDCNPGKFSPKNYYNKSRYPDDESISEYGTVAEFEDGKKNSRPLTKNERDRIGFSEKVPELSCWSEDLLDMFSKIFGVNG